MAVQMVWLLCVVPAALLILGVEPALPTTSLSAVSPNYVELANLSYEGEIIYSTDTNVYLNTSVLSIVDTSSATNTGGGIYALASGPVYAGQEIVGSDAVTSATNVTVAGAPLMTIALTITENTPNSKWNIFMYIENGATAAGNVEAIIDLSEGLLIDYQTTSYVNVGTELGILDGRRQFSWTIGNLTSNESKNDTFIAELDKQNAKNVYNIYSISVTYTQTTDPTTQEYGPMEASVCLDKTIKEETSRLYLHGFTALSFFLAFILGILAVCLGFFIYYMIRRKKLISPTKVNQEKLLMERGKTIMMDENEAVKRGGHTINDYSLVGEGDSIVGVLGMKDKMQMHREMDSLDIVNTVNVDTNLERERNNASMATTELLLTGLHSNKDIEKGTLDTALGNLRSRRGHMDKQQDEDYKREMKKLYKKISAKNRAMMSTMMQKQRTEKKELVSNTQDMPSKERNELIKLMNEQHQSEQNAETYRLKLEQDEETEKLRKEFAIRNRMGIKELQIQALNDVKDQGKLTDPQMKWLLSEHHKNQKSLEAMYDEEISKQRMTLEEKLARRKALAQSAETLEEDNDDLLNTVAGQQVIAVEKMKKNKSISAADANQLIDEAKKNMIAIKDKMERERADQENELHKKLCNLKKKRLNDLAKEQEMEQKEYDKKCQEMQTEGPIDPMTYADGKLKLLSQQRVERSNLENEIDTDQTADLSKLRSEIAVQTETELRGVNNNLRLKVDGDADAMLDKLLRDHHNETEALRNTQQRNRDKQLRKLQDRLEENREQWNQRKEVEKAEQQQLREYEDNVINKLVNSQVSMSEAERDRILKEHEKQMVTLENSLTLNKLRQKRMIEEKIAQRRAQQMEKLQLKQYKEKESQRRQMENNAEESDDENVQRKRIALMKDHVEQKMAVLHGRKMDWDTELESIRVEMLKERSLALKEQEERLGALVAQLQLSKAKELSKIEEQQKAIHNLKTNLIDDLNARGVLSDPETQAVIKRHQDEQEQLNERLDLQRVQQEKLLKQKLQQRLEQREKSMLVQQDEELKNLMAPNKTAAKIKKMLLIHKHMVAMEKMKNQLEREISQTLEQVRYEYEICKTKAIQDQEMEFISGLVRVGTIPKEELESVLHMLYPGKSEAEFKEIFDKIFDPRTEQKQGSPPMSKEEVSQLVSRVRSAQAHPPPFMRRGSHMSMGSSISSRTSSLRRSGQKKKPDEMQTYQQQQQHYNDDQFEDNSRFRPSSRQFEDTSRFQTPGRQPFDDNQQSLRSSAGRQSYDEAQQFRPSNRQSYEDQPHPLEQSYSKQDSLRQNGHAYNNRIMEEDDNVIQAEYMSGDQNYRQPPQGQLPPLSTGHKKKKKKKFLKKMASSPQPVDDMDY